MTNPGGPEAFTGQLSAAPYVLDVRRLGHRAPAPHPPIPGDRLNAAPAILLLSRSSDVEFDRLARLLRGVGVPAFRLDADALDGVGLVVDPERRSVRLNGCWFEPVVAWQRHFAPNAIGASASRPQDLFRRESWAAAIDQVVGMSRVGIRSRHLGVAGQLDLARRHGITVPPTIITTDPTDARSALRSTHVILKAVDQHFVEPSPGLLTAAFPMVLRRSDLADSPRLDTPVVFQEFLDHDGELRVYFVDGRMIAFRVVKDLPSDPWLHAERVGASVVEPPPKIVAAVRLLAAAMNLRYGAFDFLIRAGEPVFLEVNPDGDWLWLERMTGLSPVTTAVAQMLREAHHGLSSAIEGAPPWSPAPFDILTFLVT